MGIDIQKELKKGLVFLREAHQNAFNLRNKAVEIANQLKSIKAATQMEDEKSEIQKVMKLAEEKIESLKCV